MPPRVCQFTETTAEKELIKKQWQHGSRFFLASENEEWILLERPLSAATKKQMLSAFWLTRVVFLRGLGLLCSSAFASAWNQNIGLIGQNGILPAMSFYHSIIRNETFTCMDMFDRLGLFYIFPPWDITLRLVAVAGMLASLALIILGGCNSFFLLCMWGLYSSLLLVGQEWCQTVDNWDSTLCDIIFWSIWLVPLLSFHQRPQGTPPSQLSLVGFRWYLFKLTINNHLLHYLNIEFIPNNGLSFFFPKIELLPFIPSPIATPMEWYLQHIPLNIQYTVCLWLSITDVIVTLIILIGPCFQLRRCCGIIHIIIQLMFILLGRSTMVNWILILLVSFALDDGIFAYFFSEMTIRRLPLLYRSEIICSPFFSLHKLLLCMKTQRRVPNVDPTCVSTEYDPIDQLLSPSKILTQVSGTPKTVLYHDIDELHSHSTHINSYINTQIDVQDTLLNSNQLRQRVHYKELESLKKNDRLSQSSIPIHDLQEYDPCISVSNGRSIFLFFCCWSSIIVTSSVCCFWNKPYILWNMTVSILYSFGLSIVSSSLLRPPYVLKPSLYTEHPLSTTTSPYVFRHCCTRIFSFNWWYQSTPILWSIIIGLLGVIMKFILDCKFRFNWVIISFVLLFGMICYYTCQYINVTSNQMTALNHSIKQSNRQLSVQIMNLFRSHNNQPYQAWAKIISITGLREILLFYFLFIYLLPRSIIPFKPIQTLHSTFGFPLTSRFEFILEGTHHPVLDTQLSPYALWKPLQWKCGLGNLYRRPCLPLPYLYRLDYTIGTLSQRYSSTVLKNTWFPHFLCAILYNEVSVTSLLRRVPFNTPTTPKMTAIRARRFVYKSSIIGDHTSQTTFFSGSWWKREFIDQVMFPCFNQTLL